MIKTGLIRGSIYFFAVFAMIAVLATMLHAADDIKLFQQQTVYVPIYSHIYSGFKGRPFELAATLSIRNTDPKHPITLVAVTYYDTDGKLLKEYLQNPLPLGALGSIRYTLTEADTSGGSGANFIIKWKSETMVNPPIIESVMIGTKSGQGISFVSRGQVIADPFE
jgi:hypothetical protein